MSAADLARDPFEEALAHLEKGRLVAYPTETVWGLGADATSRVAVERLRAWKGGDQPLALLVSGVEVLPSLGFVVTERVHRLLCLFWPGPLTVVLPNRRPQRFAPGVAGRDGAVGLRCSPHPVAARLVARAARAGCGPLTATSLNRHGAAPARRRDEARAVVGGAPDAPYLLDDSGPDAGGAPPSTVLDCTGTRPRVLRDGALTRERLAPWLGSAPLAESSR